MASIENQTDSLTAERELVVTRILNAPRELVFQVWRDPDHIAKWWGPRGFTNTIQKMDFKSGGEWLLVMHGPDGTDYKNKSIFVEIVEAERIVYDHVSGPKFRTIVTFEKQGKKTKVTVRMVFDTVDLLNKTIKEFGADEGLKQNMDKLEEYLTKL